MSGILMATKRRSTAGGASLDTTALVAEDATAGTSTATGTFQADGTIALVGNVMASPSSPKWWGNTSPPATWMSYAITASGGTSTVVGGLVAGTRYQINTDRQLGIQRAAVGVASKQFTVSFYDAASGGTLLGTKTLDVAVESV